MAARRVAAVAATLTLVPAVAAGAIAERPNRPPKPRLELLSETQESVLRQDAVKVRVSSRHGRRARVSARLVVDGYPDDFSFRLGPEARRLRDREAKLKLPLSARQHEVLAFAEQACDGATLALRARVGERGRRLDAPLPARSC